MLIGVPETALLLLRQAALPLLRGFAAGRFRSALSLFARNVHAILRDRLWPSEVRIFRDDRDAVRSKRDSLYLQFEHRQHLRPYRRAIKQSGLHNKAAFAAFCAKHGLNHPPTAWLTDRSEGAVQAALEQLGSDAVIVKPVTGSGARGLALLRRIDAEGWQMIGRADGEVTEGSAAALLSRHCNGSELVLQPQLQNAQDIGAWMGTLLATFRTVTACYAGREPETLSMLAELPLDDEVPLPRRWLVVPVDFSDGMLPPIDADIAAKMDDEPAARAKAYPGKRIAQVPMIAELAEEAHRLLVQSADQPLPPLIGWDMVLTGEGAQILELNWNWAIAPHYRNASGLDFALSDHFAQAAR